MAWGDDGWTGRTWRWVGGAVVVAGLVGGAAALWAQVPALYASTLPEHGRATAVALTRTGVLTAGAALLALAGVLLNLLENRRATNLTHTRELYAQAVDQLGSAAIDVRLGGIYALERPARDSPPDQRTVVEVLSAFARVHSTDPALRPAPPAVPEADPGAQPEPASGPTGTNRLAIDVHAAVTVLARLPVLDGVPRADLTGADLTGPASLRRLHVRPGGSLALADLAGADLTDALTEGAILFGTRLDEANLAGAWLEDADLTYATMLKADLAGAHLFEAVGLEQHQVNAACGDERTELPRGLVRPAHWSSADAPRSPGAG